MKILSSRDFRPLVELEAVAPLEESFGLGRQRPEQGFQTEDATHAYRNAP